MVSGKGKHSLNLNRYYTPRQMAVRGVKSANVLFKRLGYPVIPRKGASMSWDIAQYNKVVRLIQKGDIRQLDYPFDCPVPRWFLREYIRFNYTNDKMYSKLFLRSYSKSNMNEYTFSEMWAMHLQLLADYLAVTGKPVAPSLEEWRPKREDPSIDHTIDLNKFKLLDTKNEQELIEWLNTFPYSPNSTRPNG